MRHSSWAACRGYRSSASSPIVPGRTAGCTAITADPWLGPDDPRHSAETLLAACAGSVRRWPGRAAHLAVPDRRTIACLTARAPHGAGQGLNSLAAVPPRPKRPAGANRSVLTGTRTPCSTAFLVPLTPALITARDEGNDRAGRLSSPMQHLAPLRRAGTAAAGTRRLPAPEVRNLDSSEASVNSALQRARPR